MPNILIAEDERPIADLIRMTLKGAGYRCDWAPDGDRAADLAGAGTYDLALVDVMLPGSDGFCPAGVLPNPGPAGDLRHRPGRGGRPGPGPSRRGGGLHRQALRRRRTPGPGGDGAAAVSQDGSPHHPGGGHRGPPGPAGVEGWGRRSPSPPREYDLLLLFLRNPNAALYRDTIYEKVWGGELAYGSKTVDLHVQRLRKKVGWEETLRAVHKVGYRLEAEP